ncbi:MAG: hypothetical protein QNL43_08380 [Crocinitomicaceae bacterium]|jgi:hypothetical protein|tara:strand:- start:56534 stop:57193 length:660 start_codon:yes stop_codon:yes gene_type:complete
MQNQFKEDFKKLTDLQLVKAFNKQLCHNGWVLSPGEYLIELRSAFYDRGLNPAAIVHMRGFHLKKEYESVLVAKKIIPKKHLEKQLPITLLLDSETKGHECIYLSPKLVIVEDPIIKLRRYMECDATPILLAVQHNIVQTLLDVTGIQDMVLIGFKTSNQIKSVNLLDGNKAHVLQIAIPSKTMLLFPKKLILECNTLLLVKRPSIEKFLNDIVKIQVN